MLTIKSPIIVLVLTALAGAQNVWQPINNSSGAAQMQSFAINPNNNHWFIGDRAGSGVWKSTDQGAHWTQINNGLTDLCIWTVDYDTAHNQLIATYVPNNNCSQPVVTFWRSSDEGASWTQIHSPSPNDAMSGAPTFNGFAVRPSDSFMIDGGFWPPGGYPAVGAFYSTDGMATTHAISWTLQTTVNCCGTMSTSYNPITNMFWIGTEAQNVLASSDGINFRSMVCDAAFGSGSNCINTTGDVYAHTYNNSGMELFTSQNGVWQQQGACTDWHDCVWRNVLPTVNAVRTMNRDPGGTLYAATDNQTSQPHYVFRSQDGGNTWQPFESGLPSAPALWHFVYNPVDHHLYAVLRGVGVYVTVNPVDQLPPPPLQPPTNLQLNVH